ncbi:MAG: hypothetical protein ACTSUF_03485 [Candidatus Heimdallarchaeaceae archaeon]
MADDYTTIRVRKTTRDLINKIASGKGISVDELLNILTKQTKDTMKQILIDVDKDKYYAMRDITKMLHQMGIIKYPKIEDMVLFGVDNLIKGMEKTLQSAQISIPPTLTGTQGQ